MSEIWVGLTEVSKAEGCELEFSGAAAFVWWATQTDSEDGFLRKLKVVVDYYKLVLIDVSKVRRFDETDEVDEKFYEMVGQARQNPAWFVFGTFHSYPYHTA